MKVDDEKGAQSLAGLATIREVTFVYPLLNTLARAQGLSNQRQLFYNTMLAKVKAAADALAAKTEEVIIKHGQRRGPLEKFQLVTPEQNAAAKAEIVQHKDGPSVIQFTDQEAELFERLLTQALLGGYEDFPEV